MTELYKNQTGRMEVKGQPWEGEVEGTGWVRSTGRGHRYQVRLALLLRLNNYKFFFLTSKAYHLSTLTFPTANEMVGIFMILHLPEESQVTNVHNGVKRNLAY